MIITLLKRKETLIPGQMIGLNNLMIGLNNLVTDLNPLIIEDLMMILLVLLIHLKDHTITEEVITTDVMTGDLTEKKVIIFNGFNHVTEN